MRTIQQQLREKGLSDGPERIIEKPNAKTSNKPKEQLMSWELVELMGSNRDTFRRDKDGTIRRNR